MSLESFESLIRDLIDQDYGFVDNFLTPELSAELEAQGRARFDNGEYHLAGIGKESDFNKDKTIRNDRVHWLDRDHCTPQELRFLEQADAFLLYLNRTCFTALHNHEFHYAVYPVGSFYKRHLDQFRNDDRRRFSVICYLNKDWKEEDGGQLVLYLPDGPKKIMPEAGRLVFFRSDVIEHEVLPTKRERFSLTGWMRTA